MSKPVKIPPRDAPKPASQGAVKTGSRRGSAPRGSMDLRDLCRSLTGVTEDIKWEDNLVFSVGGRMFAGFDVEDSEELAFKCDDDDFDRLVERGEKDGGIVPAPYAARFGWVRVSRRGALPDKELRALLVKAHALVAANLPKRVQRELGLAPPGAGRPARG